MSNLLFTTTAEADARLIKTSKAVNQPGFTLDREWSFIDASVADTLVVSLQGVLTYTNPKADGEAYTGTFVNSTTESVTADGGADVGERYVNIRQRLILVVTAATTTNLAALQYSVLDENEILSLFGVSSQTGERDSLAYKFININPSARTVMMAYLDADLVTALASTYTYKDRKFEINPDGTASFIVLFEKVVFNNVTGTTPNKTTNLVTLGYINADPDLATYGINAGIVRIAEKVPIAAVSEIIGNQPVTAGFVAARTTITDNGDGSATIVRNEDKIRVGTGAGLLSPSKSRYSGANGKHEASFTREWYNLTEADAILIVDDAITNTAIMSSATYTPEGTGYKLDTVQKDPEANGQTFSVKRVSFIPRNFSGTIPPYPNGTIIPVKMYGQTFYYADGAISETYIVRVDRKTTSSLSSAKSFASESSVNPVNGENLGSIDYNETHDVYLGYRVQLDKDTGTVNFTTATFENDGT